MANNTYYNEILTEHNIRPLHKYKMEGADFSLEGVNPSCGDDIVLYLKLDQDEKIVEASFDGDGCAISQASSDIMCDLIIGKKKDSGKDHGRREGRAGRGGDSRGYFPYAGPCEVCGFGMANHG